MVSRFLKSRSGWSCPTRLAGQAGIELKHVPYTGAGPIYAALLGGHVDIGLAQISWAQGAAKEGKVQILGLTASRRSSLDPTIPTLAEIGFTGYAADQWIGALAPRGTPAQIIDTMNRVIHAWVSSDAGKEALRNVGVEASGGTSAQLAQMQRDGTQTWRTVIQARNIKLE